MADLVPIRPAQPPAALAPVHGQMPAVKASEWAAVEAEPTRLLPPHWRGHVLGFWSYFGDVFKSQLTLCVRLREWGSQQCEIADLVRAFARMKTPDIAERFRYESDVLAALGAIVADERRRRVEAERWRQADQLPPDDERARVARLLRAKIAAWSVSGDGSPGDAPAGADKTPPAGQAPPPPRAEEPRRRPPRGGPSPPRST